MNDDLVHGQFKGNRWERVLRTEFAKGFVEPVPLIPVAVTKNETLSPMPESVRALLASRSIVLERKQV